MPPYVGKQQSSGYEMEQHSIIIDALGGWWTLEMDTTCTRLWEVEARKVLERMQKAVLSGTLNIAARTFKVVT